MTTTRLVANSMTYGTTGNRQIVLDEFMRPRPTTTGPTGATGDGPAKTSWQTMHAKDYKIAFIWSLREDQISITKTSEFLMVSDDEWRKVMQAVRECGLDDYVFPPVHDRAMTKLPF